VIRLAESIAARSRVRKWTSMASYSLKPEGKKIAVALSDEFYPSGRQDSHGSMAFHSARAVSTSPARHGRYGRDQCLQDLEVISWQNLT
jgi:hypothetical protein